jgi:hypothetical protein
MIPDLSRHSRSYSRLSLISSHLCSAFSTFSSAPFRQFIFRPSSTLYELPRWVLWCFLILLDLTRLSDPRYSWINWFSTSLVSFMSQLTLWTCYFSPSIDPDQRPSVTLNFLNALFLASDWQNSIVVNCFLFLSKWSLRSIGPADRLGADSECMCADFRNVLPVRLKFQHFILFIEWICDCCRLNLWTSQLLARFTLTHEHRYCTINGSICPSRKPFSFTSPVLATVDAS